MLCEIMKDGGKDVVGNKEGSEEEEGSGGDERESKKGEGFTNDSRSQEETHRCECMQI